MEWLCQVHPLKTGMDLEDFFRYIAQGNRVCVKLEVNVIGHTIRIAGPLLYMSRGSPKTTWLFSKRFWDPILVVR